MCLAISLTACGGAEERKSVYMDKAMSSMQVGDYDKARIELKNVLQIDPKDAEAHYQIGRVHEKLNDLRKAYSHYLKAEELDSENLKAKAALAKIYMLMPDGQDKAKENIDFILSKDPENPDGLLLKATQYYKDKEIYKAMELAEQVATNNPGHVDTAVFLATVYVRKQDYSSATKILGTAVEENPANDQLIKLYAWVLMKDNQADKAEQTYKAFIERNPKNSEGYQLLGAFYHESGNTEMAEKTLLRSIENDPDDVDRILTYVKYIKAVRGDQAAIDTMENYVKQNEDVGKLRLAQAELYLLSNRQDDAVNAYKKAIDDFSDEVTGVESRVALANIYLNKKKIEEARAIIKDALEVSPNDARVNLIRAKLAVIENDIEEAILALRIVNKETPENIEAFLLLARAYDMQGNVEQKRSTLNIAYERNRLNADGLLKLAQVHLSTDIKQAEKIIDDYNRLKTDDYEGLSIKAAILNQNKSYEDAGRIAEKLIEMYPDKPNGYLYALPQYTTTGQQDKAVSILEQGYINTEDNRKILVLLSTLQASDKKFDIVIKRIDSELNAAQDDTGLLGLKAKVLLAKGDNEGAEQVLLKVIDTDSQIVDAYLILSQIYISAKRMDDAEQILQKGKSNVAASVKIPLNLAALLEVRGKYNSTINIYRELYDKVPDNIVVVNNLAALLADHGTEEDMVQARQLANKLKEQEQAVFLDTVGWVYYKSGDYETAVSYLKRVVDKAPDVNVFNYHMGMAYKAAGDKEQARAYLEKSLAEDKPFKQREAALAALEGL
jgi:putative PEP-CTERM system TPR-repeat lipoprotein